MTAIEEAIQCILHAIVQETHRSAELKWYHILNKLVLRIIISTLFMVYDRLVEIKAKHVNDDGQFN